MLHTLHPLHPTHIPQVQQLTSNNGIIHHSLSPPTLPPNTRPLRYQYHNPLRRLLPRHCDGSRAVSTSLRLTRLPNGSHDLVQAKLELDDVPERVQLQRHQPISCPRSQNFARALQRIGHASDGVWAWEDDAGREREGY